MLSKGHIQYIRIKRHFWICEGARLIEIVTSLMTLTAVIISSCHSVVIDLLRKRNLPSYFANSNNPPWDQWTVACWSTVEVNVGIICICLPTLRLILLRIFPGVFGSGTKHGGSHGGRLEDQSGSYRKPPANDHHKMSELELIKGGSWSRLG